VCHLQPPMDGPSLRSLLTAHRGPPHAQTHTNGLCGSRWPRRVHQGMGVGMGGEDPGNPCDHTEVPRSGLSKKMGARAKGRAGRGMGGWKIGPTPSPGFFLRPGGGPANTHPMGVMGTPGVGSWGTQK